MQNQNLHNSNQQNGLQNPNMHPSSSSSFTQASRLDLHTVQQFISAQQQITQQQNQIARAGLNLNNANINQMQRQSPTMQLYQNMNNGQASSQTQRYSPSTANALANQSNLTPSSTINSSSNQVSSNVTPTNNGQQPVSFASVLRSGSSNSSEDQTRDNKVSRDHDENRENRENHENKEADDREKHDLFEEYEPPRESESHNRENSSYNRENSSYNSRDNGNRENRENNSRGNPKNFRQTLTQSTTNRDSYHRDSYTRNSYNQDSYNSNNRESNSQNKQTDSNNNPQTPSIEDILRKTTSVNPRRLEGSSRDESHYSENNFNSDGNDMDSDNAEVSMTYNRTNDSSKPSFDVRSSNIRNSSTEPEPDSISTDHSPEKGGQAGLSSDEDVDDVTPRNKAGNGHHYKHETNLETVFKNNTRSTKDGEDVDALNTSKSNLSMNESRQNSTRSPRKQDKHNYNVSTPIVKSKSQTKTQDSRKIDYKVDRIPSSPRTEKNESTPKLPKTPTAGSSNTGAEQKSGGTPGSGSRRSVITPQFLAVRAFGEIRAQASKSTTRRSIDGNNRKDSLSSTSQNLNRDGVGSESKGSHLGSGLGSESQISVKRSLTRPSPSPSPNKASSRGGKLKKSGSGVAINLDTAGSGQNSGTVCL